MIGDEKEVYFDQYCLKCEFINDDESNVDSPCYECLESPSNIDSHKPINFKEAKTNEESNRKQHS